MVESSQFYCAFTKIPQNTGFHATGFVCPMSEPALCIEVVGAFSCSVELKALTAILRHGFTYEMILAHGNSILGKADPTTEHQLSVSVEAPASKFFPFNAGASGNQVVELARGLSLNLHCSFHLNPERKEPRIFADAADQYGLSKRIRNIREYPRFLPAETMINANFVKRRNPAA